MNMLSSPNVSIIIPTYNKVEYLKQAINSILQQTYKNYELIVVDDGSTDKTFDYLQQLNAKEIRPIRLLENKGVSYARNVGIRSAKGNYIAFLDHDDIWLPEKLERQMKILEYNKEIDAIYTGYIIYDKIKNKMVGKHVPEKRGKIFKELLRENFIGTASTVIVRREKLLCTELFDEEMLVSQDRDLWIRLAKYCNFEFIKEPLVIYTIHGTNLSRNYFHVLKDRLRILEKYREYIESNDLLFDHYLLIASANFMVGYKKEGRFYITSAIKIKGMKAKAIAIFLASFLPVNLYIKLIWLRRRLLYKIASRNLCP